MNYRHAFHAGNFADCMKHAVLVWLLGALRRKPAPFFVLDTHAGTGFYDLATGPATRTQEAVGGIRRLLADPPAALDDYLAVVRGLADGADAYPGSPALIRALLRPGDRLACCELHPEDSAVLRRRFARDRAVAVHQRDAWEALGALLPPAEKRGLVLVDPPFEAPDEFARLADGLELAHARFRTGILAAWYPIKHRAPLQPFFAALADSGIRDIVSAELWLREPVVPSRLNGCGMVVINPPFRFEAEVPALLDALLSRLGAGEPGAGTAIRRLADE